MYGFGKYTFRHRRTGKTATILAASEQQALRAHTIYPEAWHFLKFERL